LSLGRLGGSQISVSAGQSGFSRHRACADWPKPESLAYPRAQRLPESSIATAEKPSIKRNVGVKKRD
jgi:hypothetical protein